MDIGYQFRGKVDRIDRAPAGVIGGAGDFGDASRLDAATIMPSYYRVDGLTRVGAAWRGKPILSAEQIEDIVAYLETLRD